MPMSREEDFLKKYINFTIFTPKLPPLWMGGHEIYNFLSLYPTCRCYTPNLVKIGSVVLEKKMLMDDGQWTMHDEGRKPIAIGHLSDSGDLKR